MEDWKCVELTDIDQLPTGYGTYAFLVNAEVVYIGRSKCLWRRIREHLRKQPSLNSSDCCLYYSDDYSDYCREKQLIQAYCPELNVAYLIK